MACQRIAQGSLLSNQPRDRSIDCCVQISVCWATILFAPEPQPLPDVTRILSQIESGDPAAAEQLLPLIYAELRRLAKSRMANERVDHTLQATGAFPFCGLVLCVYAGVCEDLLGSSDFRVMDWGVQFQSGR
jgi:hypothetical protein